MKNIIFILSLFFSTCAFANIGIPINTQVSTDTIRPVARIGDTVCNCVITVIQIDTVNGAIFQLLGLDSLCNAIIQQNNHNRSQFQQIQDLFLQYQIDTTKGTSPFIKKTQ